MYTYVSVTILTSGLYWITNGNVNRFQLDYIETCRQNRRKHQRRRPWAIGGSDPIAPSTAPPSASPTPLPFLLILYTYEEIEKSYFRGLVNK